MAQSTIDIEAILRRLNKEYNEHPPRKKGYHGRDRQRRDLRLPSGWPDIVEAINKRRPITLRKPKSIRPKPPGSPRGRHPGQTNKSSILDTPSIGVNSKGALERRMKSRGNREDASKEKKRSRGGKPQWQKPDDLGINYRRAKRGLRLVQPRLKVDWGDSPKGDKNYTQSPDSEDYKWNRDRRVKKSQGRPIEETPKRTAARKQQEQGAAKRRNKEEEELAKKKGYKSVKGINQKAAAERRLMRKRKSA